MKDIKNKTLEIQCDKNELYIIENNKEYIWCENFSKKDLVLIYIATKAFDLSDVCIGRAYDIFGNEIPDAYGLFISSEYNKNLPICSTVCDIQEKFHERNIYDYSIFEKQIEWG